MDELKKNMEARLEATRSSLNETRKEQIETVKDVSVNLELTDHCSKGMSSILVWLNVSVNYLIKLQ